MGYENSLMLKFFMYKAPSNSEHIVLHVRDSPVVERCHLDKVVFLTLLPLRLLYTNQLLVSKNGQNSNCSIDSGAFRHDLII